MYFEDLATDMSAAVSKPITERDVETFAAVSTDTNPIHLSDEFAASTKFKRRIAHGLLTASLISAVLGTKLPGPGAIYVSQNLKFTAPVYLGDVVTARVTLVSLDSLHRFARFDCVCRVGSKMVLSGDAVLYVPNRPAELAAPRVHPQDAERYLRPPLLASARVPSPLQRQLRVVTQLRNSFCDYNGIVSD